MATVTIDSDDLELLIRIAEDKSVTAPEREALDRARAVIPYEPDHAAVDALYNFEKHGSMSFEQAKQTLADLHRLGWHLVKDGAA